MLEYEIVMPEEDIDELYDIAMSKVASRYTEEELLDLLSYDEGEFQCS